MTFTVWHWRHDGWRTEWAPRPALMRGIQNARDGKTPSIEKKVW